MVTNGKVVIVWVQSICRSSENDTAVICMISAGEEIGIVTYSERQMGLDVLERNEGLLLERYIVLQHIRVWSICCKDALNVLSHNRMYGPTQGCECVQIWV